MDIRKIFLDYFEKNGHLIMPSASLIPADDPSVLLTTAGMQQFKPYYLGIEKPPKTRISTIQKCFRTSDIDRVGYTNQHLTFFEMLGNFAFADYFKKEAINYSMDFLLNILKIPVEKLSVGVFAGDGGIPKDREAIEFWKKIGIPDERIYKFGKCENFWGPAGDTGPCGPCTEIYYDFGEEFGCGDKDCNPNCNCDRFLEIWNLVFTQYNFNGKKYLELPNKNIDTGMGLERIAAVLEGDPSVFRTSLFKEIIKKIEKISGKKLSDENSENNRGIKIIADHSRAITFLISDGVLPSNEGRGYILRRILRRAIRFGRIIGIEGYFLNEISSQVIRSYEDAYPQLEKKKEFLFGVINDEEKRFSQTLKDGTKVLMQNIEASKSMGKKYMDAKDAFRLYDTFGFPVELTVEVLKENDLDLDFDKFNEYLKSHSRKSKEKTTFNKKIDSKIDLYKKLAMEFELEFVGYNQLKASSEILSIIKTGIENKETVIQGCHPDKEKTSILYPEKSAEAGSVNTLSEGERGELVIKATPFYGEKGGQAGDRGTISTNTAKFIVEDTKIPVEGLIIHGGWVSYGKLNEGDEIIAEVDSSFRKNISKNHTATHILHWALRAIYGKEVTQAGSFVGDDRFRFDYNIHKEVSGESIEKIEKIINERIQKDDIVRCFETTKEYADELGAISLFGEKYGKFVRVVEINNYSRELCGGIHVGRTGEIGLLKIISDSSIGANVRRIEAYTGMYAYSYLANSNKILKGLAVEMDTDENNIKSRFENIKNYTDNLEEDFNFLQINSAKKEILSKFPEKPEGNLKVINFDFTGADFKYKLDAKRMGMIGDEIINSLKGLNVFIVLGNIINGKPVLLLQASSNLLNNGIDCSMLAREAGKILKGGGGGKKEFAQVGGSDVGALGEAISFIVKKVREILDIKGSRV